MQLKDIKTFVVGNASIHRGGPYWVFVKVTTDCGVVGYGEVYGVAFHPKALTIMMGPRRASTAPSGTFQTKDGYIQINIVRDPEFATFCKLLKLDELWANSRFHSIAGRLEEIDFLNNTVQGITIEWNTAALSEVLSKAGLQNEVVQSYRDFVEHPQAAQVGVFAWLEQAGDDDPWPVPNIPGLPKFTVGEVLSQSPTVGQHTRALLSELGYPEAEIERLYTDGAVA